MGYEAAPPGLEDDEVPWALVVASEKGGSVAPMLGTPSCSKTTLAVSFGCWTLGNCTKGSSSLVV
jgi:hypothetical protein